MTHADESDPYDLIYLTFNTGSTRYFISQRAGINSHKSSMQWGQQTHSVKKELAKQRALR